MAPGPHEFTHWNPVGRQHGLANPEDPQAGDLPDLEVDRTGCARYTAATDGRPRRA